MGFVRWLEGKYRYLCAAAVVASMGVGCGPLSSRSPNPAASDGGEPASAGQPGVGNQPSVGGKESGVGGKEPGIGGDGANPEPQPMGGSTEGGEAGASAAAPELELTPSSASFDAAIGVKTAPTQLNVTNAGDGESGPLIVELSGSGFVLVSDECSGESLSHGHSCNVGVAFLSTVATKDASGELAVSAQPGGSAVAELTGSARAPAHLALAPDTGASAAFGDVIVGTQTEQRFVLSNSGEQATSPLEIELAGSAFKLLAPSGQTDCVSGATVLASGQSCSFSVSFTPAEHGAVTGLLSATAAVGGTTTPLALSGNGLLPPTLSADFVSKDFGILEVGVASPAFLVTLTNDGDLATGAIARSNTSELVPAAGCASLAPHASCSLKLVYTASASGARAEQLSLVGAAGGSFTFKGAAEGRFRLTVERPGGAAGKVVSTPSGIDCTANGGATCSALFANGTVQLGASTTNGSNSFFSGWSGACSGLAHACSVPFVGATSVKATFSPMSNNLIFATHQRFDATLGSATAYDAKCNDAATSAGMNQADGKGYVAFLSSPGSLATTRLGAARGWVRLDGRAFGDTIASMLVTKQIFNDVHFDDLGAPVSTVLAMTGTLSDGTLGDTCSGWTTLAGDYTYGEPFAGPGEWSGANGQTIACKTGTTLICMGNTKTAPLAAQVVAGRKLWLTNTGFTPGGGMTPDQKCQSERAVGVTTAVALLSYAAKPAAALLSPTQSYVRPDGTLIGNGAELANTQTQTGIWQSADGAYQGGLGAWTGSPKVSDVGTQTCADWTSTAGNTVVGVGSTAFQTFGWKNSDSACSEAFRLYCLQTAP